VAEGGTLELEVLRKPPKNGLLIKEPPWPPAQILVRIPSFGGLTPDPSDAWGRSRVPLVAIGALAQVRPAPAHSALRPLLDGIGGARSRPRIRGFRGRLKLMLATARALLSPPGNLRVLIAAAGRAPLRDTADDLLKLELLHDVARGARLESKFEPASATLCLVTKPAGADGCDPQIPKDVEVSRIVWDNSAISTYCAAPVILGRRVTVFVGAAGVHEFTAIEALPDSSRKAVLRRLSG
jgi:hypothetical protein